MADLTTTQPAMPSDVQPFVQGQEGEPQDPQKKAEDLQKILTRDIEKHFKTQVEQAEADKRQYTGQWKRNIELRQGMPYGPTASYAQDVEDTYQSEVNPDWYLTKTKTANLYSQVPTVRLTHENPQYAAAIAPFAKALNYELSDRRCNIGAAMYEVLNDVVNASGIGALHVGYAARFEDRQIPKEDTKLLPPDQVQAMMQAGTLPMETVPYVVDYRFFTHRISPADLLWPKGFVGSDFDAAPWIGFRFKQSWAEAKQEWHLTDEDKALVTGGDDREETLRTNQAGQGQSSSELKPVRGKRIYYWRYRVDPDCPSFSEIWEIVWLDGKDDNPVSHQAWNGQHYVEDTGKYVGACRFPVRVVTTTYISDNPIPPSDSQAGRPQVNDLRRSRNQMFQNRAFSTPLRWFNTDKTDPLMHDLLMKGQIQGMIPVQGDGSRMIGEVARASYPAEDLTFDKMTGDDLMKSWGIGPNQIGMLASRETTKGEANLAQGGFNTVMGVERAQVTKFFLSGVEVLAGLMALYSDFPSLGQQERVMMMQAWDRQHILHDLAFKILPDSQIVLDTEQKIQRTEQLLNMTAKSGYVNIKPLITELVELHGYDPAELVVDPQSHPAKPAGLSFTFTGKEDLNNPLVVALLARNQQLPSPQELEEARMLLAKLASGEPIQPPQPPPGAPGQLGPGPQHPQAVPGQDHQPQWSLANKIAKRSRDAMGGGA